MFRVRFAIVSIVLLLAPSAAIVDVTGALAQLALPLPHHPTLPTNPSGHGGFKLPDIGIFSSAQLGAAAIKPNVGRFNSAQQGAAAIRRPPHPAPH